jgi:hypothetical protein
MNFEIMKLIKSDNISKIIIKSNKYEIAERLRKKIKIEILGTKFFYFLLPG